MKKLTFMFVLLLAFTGAAKAQNCNCNKAPFVPDPPCWEICTVGLLSGTGLDQLIEIIGIRENVARKIVNWPSRSSARQLDDYGAILSAEEQGHVESRLRSLSDSQLKALIANPRSELPANANISSASGASAVEAVEAKNKQIEADNALMLQSFNRGNAALQANRLDEAIDAYRAGLRVWPEEPSLLANLSEALRRRGVNSWNDALKGQEPAKTQGLNAAKKDWTEAASKAATALQSLRQLSAEQLQHPGFQQTKLAAIASRALTMRLVATKVDQTQVQAAWEANLEYAALVSEPEAKSRLKGAALEMLFDAGAYDLAISHARSALKEDPQHLVAHRVLGLALFASGDKLKYQEALTHLQQYVDKAPDTDALKQSAKEVIKVIKENSKP